MTCEHKRYLDQPDLHSFNVDRFCLDCGGKGSIDFNGDVVWPIKPYADPVQKNPATVEEKPSMTPGYRVLSQEESGLVSMIRQHGVACDFLLKMLGGNGADPHWLAIARTQMQQGVMAAVRAVTKPEFF